MVSFVYYQMRNLTKINEIISAIKEHPVSLTEIFDQAKRIKRNLMVSDQERQNIALATKAQSNCQAWFEHRRVRITASQSKRALIKPSTSPTKAMKEILRTYVHMYVWRTSGDKANLHRWPISKGSSV